MNNDTNAMELKPCPFCGGEAQRFTLTEEDEPMNAGGDVITCLKCQASSHVEFGRKENLAECWNTRTTSLAAQDVDRVTIAKAIRDADPTIKHSLAVADAVIASIGEKP